MKPPKTTKSKFNPWPEAVLAWLMDEEEEQSLSEHERAARIAMAKDSRLRGVARRLTKLAPDPSSIRDFLKDVLSLPAIWRALNAREKDFRKNEVAELYKATDQFLRVWQKKQSVVEAYLSGWPDNHLGLDKGKAKVAEIASALQVVRDLARSGNDIYYDDDVPQLEGHSQHKRRPDWGKVAFVVRQIAKRARDGYFGLPYPGHLPGIPEPLLPGEDPDLWEFSYPGELPYSEVALLTNVTLALKDEIGAEDVRNLLRPPRVIPGKRIPKSPATS
jgi:hypothetical protein